MMSSFSVTPTSVRNNYEEILRRGLVASGGRKFEIIAISKTFTPEAVACAYQAGLRDFGENYADELIEKSSHDSLMFGDDPLRWHFVGSIQSRKVKKLARYVSIWHSVARKKEIDLISNHSVGARIFVQVRFDQSDIRNGVAIGEAEELVNYGRENGLKVLGLMTVPPIVDSERLSRIFESVNAERERLKLDYCSMGMSEDFELALRSGATHVRIGRAIFGRRLNVDLGSGLGQGGPS